MLLLSHKLVDLIVIFESKLFLLGANVENKHWVIYVFVQCETNLTCLNKTLRSTIIDTNDVITDNVSNIAEKIYMIKKYLYFPLPNSVWLWWWNKYGDRNWVLDRNYDNCFFFEIFRGDLINKYSLTMFAIFVRFCFNINRLHMLEVILVVCPNPNYLKICKSFS